LCSWRLEAVAAAKAEVGEYVEVQGEIAVGRCWSFVELKRLMARACGV
jgi:hypothetical protein